MNVFWTKNSFKKSATESLCTILKCPFLQVKCFCSIGSLMGLSSPLALKCCPSPTEIKKIESIPWSTFSLGWPNAHSTNSAHPVKLKNTTHCAFSPWTFSMRRFTSSCGSGCSSSAHSHSSLLSTVSLYAFPDRFEPTWWKSATDASGPNASKSSWRSLKWVTGSSCTCWAKTLTKSSSKTWCKN